MVVAVGVGGAVAADAFPPPSAQGLRIANGYRGLVLVEGHHAEGNNWLGSERGDHPLGELQIPPVQTGSRREWRAFPSYTRVRAGAGCYAYEIDGTTFSRVLVFQLKP